MWMAVEEECPQAEYTGIALEYGTVPLMEVFDALRADQWLENHPETPEAQRVQIKQQTRDAFYTDTDEWKRRIVEQGVEASTQAVRGLAAD
jgi:predicted Abi (CAAX) family protease